MVLAVSAVAFQDALFSSLDCAQFSHALSMCGLVAFAKRGSRLQQGATGTMQAPEQQLAAFLTFMGLDTLPGHQQLAAQQAAGSTAAAAGGGKRGSQRHIGSREFCCSTTRRCCWLTVN